MDVRGEIGPIRGQLGQTMARWPALILRFVLGLNLFFTAGSWLSDDDRGGSLVRQMAPRLEGGHTVGFYEPWLRDVVLEHPELFAQLVTLGEAFVAVSLLAGLATRAGAAVGAFLMANYALGWGNSFLPPSGNWMWFWQFVFVFLAAPGRILGIDVWLRRRWPRTPLW